MKERISGKALIAVLLIYVIGSCARISSPTGGPKDEDPPVVVESTPQSGSTEFNGKSIVVTFNEYLALSGLTEKFMISPPMNVKPQIYLRGKDLHIDFKEALKDSTTYTLYFQDAVRDLNEGNPVDNYQFVFATGKVIDSLSVTGNVLLAENLEPGKNILVMLHAELADSAPRKLLPNYITLADINGGFRINNVKEGRYRIYALADNNNNKKYDLSNETFAFTDSVAEITPQNNYLPQKEQPKDSVELKPGEKKKAVPGLIDGRYKLFLFTTSVKNRYLTSSSRKTAKQLQYTLSLPPDTMKFSFRIDGSENKDYLTEKSITGDTVTIWLRDSALYNQQRIRTIIDYPFTDSLGRDIYRTDTIEMRYVAEKTYGRRQARPSWKISHNIPFAGISPDHQITFTSPIPLQVPDTSKIRLFELKESQRKEVPFQLLPDSTGLRKYHLKAVVSENGKYLLIADAGAFRNIFNDASDSTGVNFNIRPANSFGHLQMLLKGGKGNLIYQLLDDKEKVVREARLVNGGNIDFPMIERGNYRARVIYDLDGNGSWTTGDYDLKKQPEPVSYFPKEIEIKIDWIVIESWDIATRNRKELKSKEKGEQIRSGRLP